MCLVCGLKNSFGLHASFFELDNNELLAVFKPKDEHQSYPGRLHGGIISTILDEVIGRAIMIHSESDIWGVTVDLQIRFKKPVPLDEELRILGRITKDSRRFFEGTGDCMTVQLLPKGTVNTLKFHWKTLPILMLIIRNGRLLNQTMTLNHLNCSRINF
jgi:hypothetical protein